MTYNVLVLAYLGDAVYELEIRKYLLSKKINKVNDLQNKAVKYVSAKSQSAYLKQMIDEKFLSEDEIAIVKRGRNHNITRHPKNTDIVTYKYSTGFETLIGSLYLENKTERISEIIKFIIGG
jgi:Uncharacterized protein conserved in bacteria